MQSEYAFPMELKEVSDAGTFQGIASVYGVEDLGGDIIEKGAFKKTFSENSIIPILWQHRQDEVIGMGEVKEWQGKVLIDGKLDMEDVTAQKAFKKMKSGRIKGLSIGFNAVKTTFELVEKEGASKLIRHISELKLWEVSVVTFPMLQQAQVLRVKSVDDQALVNVLMEAIDKKFQALQATITTSIVPAIEAGTGAEAAIVETSEPEALHSLEPDFFSKWRSEIAGSLR